MNPGRGVNDASTYNKARLCNGSEGVTALEFLTVPNVAKTPISSRIAFLKSKGFTETEISVALRLAGEVICSGHNTSSPATRQPACVDRSIVDVKSEAWGPVARGHAWNSSFSSASARRTFQSHFGDSATTRVGFSDRQAHAHHQNGIFSGSAFPPSQAPRGGLRGCGQDLGEVSDMMAAINVAKSSMQGGAFFRAKSRGASHGLSEHYMPPRHAQGRLPTASSSSFSSRWSHTTPGGLQQGDPPYRLIEATESTEDAQGAGLAPPQRLFQSRPDATFSTGVPPGPSQNSRNPFHQDQSPPLFDITHQKQLHEHRPPTCAMPLAEMRGLKHDDSARSGIQSQDYLQAPAHNHNYQYYSSTSNFRPPNIAHCGAGDIPVTESGYPGYARHFEARRYHKTSSGGHAEVPRGSEGGVRWRVRGHGFADGVDWDFPPSSSGRADVQWQEQHGKDKRESSNHPTPDTSTHNTITSQGSDDALPWFKTIASGRVQKHLMRFVNNFISQQDLEDELGLYMADIFYETETGPTMMALYDKLERRVSERCPGHLTTFREEALQSLHQLMQACEEREEQQEQGRKALKSSGQRGKPVRNAAKRLGKSRTEARKLGAMIAHYRSQCPVGNTGYATGKDDAKDVSDFAQYGPGGLCQENLQPQLRKADTPKK